MLLLRSINTVRFIMAAIVMAAASSCVTNKLKQIELTETQAWELSYRMVKSNILDENELGIKQFDSLLQSNVSLEPKFLSAGLELLHRKGEHQRMREIFQHASHEAKTYVCQRGWVTQTPDSTAKSLCTGIVLKKQVAKNPELQKELVIMFYNDQTVRSADMSGLAKEFGLQLDSISYNLDAVATDALNREKLKSMIAAYGFPSKSMVGDIGMESIFFVIQHADQDIAFQQAQFSSIEAAVKRGDLEGQKYAYLYDRIKINSGEPQRYGTQFSKVDAQTNTAQLAPVEDRENLDKRRKEMGMMPIKIYEQLMLAFANKQTIE